MVVVSCKPNRYRKNAQLNKKSARRPSIGDKQKTSRPEGCSLTFWTDWLLTEEKAIYFFPSIRWRLELDNKRAPRVRELFCYKSFFISLTTWPISGRINLFIASLTAPVEPGVEKTPLFFTTPAIARESIAAEPISS
jgi:hypothetical protein